MDFDVIPLIVSAKALIPVGRVDPYGELGIGAYFTQFNVSDNLNTFDGDATFGIHAGAGLNVNIIAERFHRSGGQIRMGQSVLRGSDDQTERYRVFRERIQLERIHYDLGPRIQLLKAEQVTIEDERGLVITQPLQGLKRNSWGWR